MDMFITQAQDGAIYVKRPFKGNRSIIVSLLLLVVLTTGYPSWSQVPPSRSDRAGYTGLFVAALTGDSTEVIALVSKGADPNVRDGHGRTPIQVAAYAGHHEAMRVLVAAGADPNALDSQRYDIVTIAAVANDLPTLEVSLSIGGDPTNTTSPYDGTALIAAAHLGHVEVVRALAEAGAPLDHVNNLGWTALIEAIVLGDGGPRHAATVSSLLSAGADPNLPDRSGSTPLSLAKARGFDAITTILRQSWARSR